MRNILSVFIAVFLCTTCLSTFGAGDVMLKTEDIRVRDPFIYADRKTKTYYLYAQSENRKDCGFTGVEAYAGRDLVHWDSPKPVLTLPDNAGIRAVWAPEVHEYNGSFYLFVTLTFKRALTEEKPVKTGKWPTMYQRGTYVYRADSPAGPFKSLKGTSHTPSDWMALDGTLFVEDGTPYMVFCHEWVQVVDGTMDVIQLKEDLSDTLGDPRVLFRASDAPGARTGPQQGKVTDGCFLYRSALSGKLFMIWSTFISGSGYCVLLTESRSGKIHGPWINQKPIYKENGGHGMIFRSFDERLMLALHHPNGGGRERLRLYELSDDGHPPGIKEEVILE